MQDPQNSLQSILDAGTESYELQHQITEDQQSEVVHALSSKALRSVIATELA